jgi:hypothetical protein
MRHDKLNDQQLKTLTDAHCRMYENRIRRANEGARGIRVDECQVLLGIWQSIEGKLQQGNWRLRLTKDEVAEIQDALDSGEYDALLAKAEDAPS